MKMFMKKRFIILLPVIVLIVLGCMMPNSVHAADSDFVVDANGVLTKYNGIGGDVVIPSEIDGIKVTSIGSAAFYGCSNLTDITFPEGLKSIGQASFKECGGLTSIILPSSVESVGSTGFGDCNKLKAVYVYNDITDLSCMDGTFGNKNITTLYAHKGSTTEAYANKYGYKFVELTDTKPLLSISLNKLTINMDIGKSSLLSVIYNPSDTTDDKTVTWTSSNPAVAHVYSNGKVKGISSGTAVITATVGGKTATCIVTVR